MVGVGVCDSDIGRCGPVVPKADEEAVTFGSMFDNISKRIRTPINSPSIHDVLVIYVWLRVTMRISDEVVVPAVVRHL